MAARLHLLPFAVLLLVPAIAAADDDAPPGPPPQQYPQQQPIYPTPLNQPYQGTYVPQSVALSGPEEIEPEDDRRAPAGYTEVHRTRKHLIVGGAVTLGVTWFMSSMIASVAHDAGTNLDPLYVPVAGPFLEMGNTDNATARFFLASLGGAELAGAIMLYYGVSSTNRVFVRNDLVGDLHLAPLASRDVQGFALAGSF